MVEGLLCQPSNLDLHALDLHEKVSVELIQVLFLLVLLLAALVDLLREVLEVLGCHNTKF